MINTAYTKVFNKDCVTTQTDDRYPMVDDECVRALIKVKDLGFRRMYTDGPYTSFIFSKLVFNKGDRYPMVDDGRVRAHERARREAAGRPVADEDEGRAKQTYQIKQCDIACVYIYIYIHTYTYYVYMYICIHIYVLYIYTHKQHINNNTETKTHLKQANNIALSLYIYIYMISYDTHIYIYIYIISSP